MCLDSVWRASSEVFLLYDGDFKSWLEYVVQALPLLTVCRKIAWITSQNTTWCILLPILRRCTGFRPWIVRDEIVVDIVATVRLVFIFRTKCFATTALTPTTTSRDTKQRHACYILYLGGVRTYILCIRCGTLDILVPAQSKVLSHIPRSSQARYLDLYIWKSSLPWWPRTQFSCRILRTLGKVTL